MTVEEISNIEIISTAVIATLIAALILFFCKQLWNRRADKISLKADLSIATSLKDDIGCPYILVSVACTSKNPVKISTASLTLQGINLLPEFKSAFGPDFWAPVIGGLPKERYQYRIELHPLSEHNHSDGWILQRNESCHFALPLVTPNLVVFTESPSEDVSIKVILFDGGENTVILGFNLLQQIKTLINTYDPNDYKLSPNVDTRIELKLPSSSLPDTRLLGNTNQNALIIDPQNRISDTP